MWAGYSRFESEIQVLLAGDAVAIARRLFLRLNGPEIIEFRRSLRPYHNSYLARWLIVAFRRANRFLIAFIRLMLRSHA
jgi:hypothetical protein